MRHQRTNVPPKTEVLSARSGHQQKRDLTLVVRVPATAVKVLSVDDDQVEAVEEKSGRPSAFLGSKGDISNRGFSTAQHQIMIHWSIFKSSTNSCDNGTDDA